RAHRSGSEVGDEHDKLLAWRALQITSEQNNTLDWLILGACAWARRSALRQDCAGGQPNSHRGGEQHKRQLAIEVDGASHGLPPRSERAPVLGLSENVLI